VLHNNTGINTTGFGNTAGGARALIKNATGQYNIGLGFNVGTNIVAGSNNIEIGQRPLFLPSPMNPTPFASASMVRRKKTFIAGISGTPVLGADVTVNSNGQLGVLPSSARYKHDIHHIGSTGTGLMKLRPVSFRYKSDPSGTLQ
jgi:Chaperone of endosialidase